MYRRLSFPNVVLAVTTAIVSIVLLTSGPARTAYAEALRLQVVTEEWRPYNYLDNGEIKGASTRIVRLVLERAGIAYDIDLHPWSRAYHTALQKPNVMIYSIIRIAQREALFKWVRPLGHGGTTSLYRLRAREDIKIDNLEAAKQFVIATNSNSMDHIWLQHHEFPNLETPSRVEHAVKMFFHGRTDLIAFDSAVLKDEFTRLGFDPAEVVEVMPLFNTPPYMAVSTGTPDAIVERLQTAYDELLKENAFELVN